MGHILAEVASRLITNGFVTGIQPKTISSGKLFFCQSHVYAKATRKPVLKVHEGKCAAEIGSEIQ